MGTGGLLLLAEGARRMAGHLQHRAPASGPQHERANPASGLHRRPDRQAVATNAETERRQADSQPETGFNAPRNPRRLKPLQNAVLSGEYRLCTSRILQHLNFCSRPAIYASLSDSSCLRMPPSVSPITRRCLPTI